MKLFYCTILFILTFILSVNICFSQAVFKFQVQYMYISAPDNPAWKIDPHIPKEWSEAGRLENHFITFDMTNRVLYWKAEDYKDITIHFSDINKENQMTMDSSLNIRFEFLSSWGEKIRCVLFKDPSQSACEKCFTYISYGKEREDKFILEFIPAIL